MKVAVTGATGFIGHHVVAALERRQVPLTLLVRPSTNVPEKWSRHRVVQQDLLSDPSGAHEILGKPDVLIHLAWGGLPNYRSLLHFEHELPLHYRFLKEMVDGGLPHLLATGTCFEYGMQSGALSELLPAYPANPYGFAKDAMRQQLSYLQSKQAFELSWTRLFYMYGQGQSANSIYSQLSAAVARGDSTFPMSGGEQLRDYLEVSQVADYLVALALLPRGSGVVNICSGQPVSVRKQVDAWIAEQRWAIKPSLGHFPYPDYEPMAFWGDRTKLDLCLAGAD